MSQALKVGVVGVGYLGKFHAKIYSEMAGVELVGVVDLNQETVSRIAMQYGCASYTDISSLITQVDAVSIVVPTSIHRQIAEPFIKAGVHIMMEKPIASTVEDSQYLVSLAKQYQVTLQVGHLERFNAGMQCLANLIHNREKGVTGLQGPRYIDVRRLSAFTSRATDVDVVIDLMIHDIEIVLSLVSSELDQVSATGTTVVTNYIDIANARLKFRNGAVANITASRVSRQGTRHIRVFEQDRYLSLDFQSQTVELVQSGKCQDEQGFPLLETTKLEVTKCLPLDEELADFIRCLRKDVSPLVTGEMGLRALEVAEQIKTQIQLGS